MKGAEFGFQTERGWRNQRWMRAKLGMDDKMGKPKATATMTPNKEESGIAIRYGKEQTTF